MATKPPVAKQTPTRIVQVPDHGEFKVPRHVSRVDSGNASPGGWHGWQVRWPDHRRFFTDAAHGGPVHALAVAKKHVRDEYPGKRSQCKPDAGVRVVHVERADRSARKVYVEVTMPDHGAAAKRLYVGLEPLDGGRGTFSAKSLDAKVAEGFALRATIIARHQHATGRY